MAVNSLSILKARLQLYWRPLVPRSISTIAIAMLLTFAYNSLFIQNVWSWASATEAWPLLALLFLLNLLLCQLFSLGKLQKIWLFSLIVIAAAGQYFMQQYGVLLDKGMLQNALETDSHEVLGLLNTAMLPYFAWYVLIPGAFLLWTRHQPQSSKSATTHYLAMLLATLVLSAGLIISQYPQLAPALRQHRDLKHYAIPFNAFNATAGVIKSKTAQANTVAFSHYAEDARLASHSARPQLVIMVLGETLRADHLGINGYSRNTTPKLAQRPLVNIGAVSACGTATAVSVPCMFSYLNQQNYQEQLAKHSDNVLDILQRAGVEVIWRDNNSGCKGMCDRVAQDTSFLAATADGCKAGECQDSQLLHGLKARVLAAKTSHKPVLVVLHQQGNHGPEYFKRSRDTQKQFLPECRNNLLNQCPPDTVINAYDNAILATDELLDNTISLLQSLAADFDTSMLYVSDHGESLGENGVYLHGLPYWLAPDSQTQVPMLMWFSEQSKQNRALDTQCITQNARHSASHDMLFDSLLGWFQVQSQAIRPGQNMFNSCTNLAGSTKPIIPAS